MDVTFKSFGSEGTHGGIEIVNCLELVSTDHPYRPQTHLTYDRTSHHSSPSEGQLLARHDCKYRKINAGVL